MHLMGTARKLEKTSICTRPPPGYARVLMSTCLSGRAREGLYEHASRLRHLPGVFDSSRRTPGFTRDVPMLRPTHSVHRSLRADDRSERQYGGKSVSFHRCSPMSSGQSSEVESSRGSISKIYQLLHVHVSSLRVPHAE